ncbi:MAG: PDZ domain-containing protein [Nitrospiraceae bacterium]|nr:MAG: PDZ domain-containing protein [Nitrospiraceae bacterium]
MAVVLLTLMTGAALASADSSPDRKNAAVSADKSSDKRGKDVIAMAEEFGLIVGPVTEDIRKELNLRSAEGVAVFEIIGDSLAERAGIKVGAVITEINKKPVKSLDDFGRLLTEVLKEGNFTVGTWEPTSPENQGIGQQMNFHFVPKLTD